MRGMILGVVLALAPAMLGAAVVGRATSAEPITEARIAILPESERPAWLAYLARSRALMGADKAALAAERQGIAVPPPPAPGPSGGAGMPLDRAPEWYAGLQARHAADVIVSFQTPAGGWGKNVDRAGPLRARGQFWVPVEKLPAYARTDIQADQSWNYVGTFDNNATTTELRFLARVQAQVPGAAGEPYRNAFLKGMRYLLAAQFPNGGWPQVFPLQGGYHDALTFNDDVVSDIVAVLDGVAGRQGDYAFVPPALAVEARGAAERAVALVLATQVRRGGVPTIWGQQHDALTLAPVGARAFEPAALASAESAGLLMLLMQRPEPTPAVRAAVAGGVAWLRDHALRDVEWTRGKPGPEGRRLVPRPGAGPIWARYYDLATAKPIFGDRDYNVYDDVNALSLERRNGYSWFGTAPAKAIAAYERWPGR